MSKGPEKITASLELCKLIPAGEFEDTALVWRERIGYVSSSVSLKFRDPEDISYKVESVKVNYFPAPTAEEIMEKLDEPVLWRSDNGKWHCSCNCKVSTRNGKSASDCALWLWLWLRVKGIESK